MTDPSELRAGLRADCSRCVALCCVATTLVASADFAIDKPAGVPCPKLADDFGCSIHDRLAANGFPGCAAYDCFGAGQKVAQRTFPGRDWRTSPDLASSMFAAFGAMRPLHELLWLLADAVEHEVGTALHDELTEAIRETERLTRLGADVLTVIDVDAHRGQVNGLLRRASAVARAGQPQAALDLNGAELVGSDLRGRDLRGASLRGAVLVGADLRGARLGWCDLTGADLRGADLRETDLSRTLFLAQGQVAAAVGDDRTALPAWIHRPPHWIAVGVNPMGSA